MHLHVVPRQASLYNTTHMIRILQRTNEGYSTSASVEALPAILALKPTLLWIDIFDDAKANAKGHAPSETRQQLEYLLGQVFQFHPLAVDDVITESHVPKVDAWENYIYIVTHAVQFDNSVNDVDTSELDAFIGPNYLLTYHDEAIAALERVWTNCMRDDRHIRRGPDYLFYELSDAIATDYLPCMDAIDEALDHLEAKVFDRPTTETISQIFKLKSTVLNLRRVLSPQREVMNKLARDDYDVIDAKDRIYFRDVYDHFVRMVDLNESLRDLVSGTLDTYLSVTANKTNDIVKSLTIITLLFMPLSFITGFFGMNFFANSLVIDTVVSPYLLFGLAIFLMIAIPGLIYLVLHHRHWM